MKVELTKNFYFNRTKVIVPNIVCDIVDRAIQMHGGAGVSQVFPLAKMYAGMRTLRLADGPDEVHRRAIARYELGKYTVTESGVVESSEVSRS